LALRLAELNAALEQAEQDLQAAQAGHQTAASELASINAQEQSARAARKQADHVATETMRQVGRAEARRHEEARGASEALELATKELGTVGDLSERREALEGFKRAVEDARAEMFSGRTTRESGSRSWTSGLRKPRPR